MKLRKYGLPLVFAASLLFAASPSIDPSLYLSDVKYLASPELKGRATGSPELEQAAAFISGKFREFGLKPADGKDYYQAFEVTTSAKTGPANRFAYADSGRSTTLQFQKDYTPFNFSHSGHLAGAVVFAGYGITAPEYHYDDYADLEVKGKIVLIARHEPQEFDEQSVFAGKSFTQHAQFASKASNAKMHGAAGLILFNDLPNHKDDEDKLQIFGAVEGPEDAGIPFVQVKEQVVERWFADAGRKLDRTLEAIDHGLKPQSFAFPDSLRVDVNVDLERLVKTVHNVDAYIPGTTDEYVIVGAHYDHLGLGGQFSLAPNQTGTVHPGADDNASGTAGVIELARWYARQPKQKRGILFLTFTGEELGLLGSAWWASHPELPLEKAVAMINMDMIGRPRGGKVYLGGSGSGSTFRPMVERLAVAHPELKVEFSEGPESGSSDHTSFTARKVPALFFFSGLHGDYHKPSDTWEKIDPAGAAQILSLAGDVIDELRASDARPEFLKVAPPARHGGEGDTGAATQTSGYGPWFGSVPDFAEGVQGVKFADVTAGSPAAKAGLLAGDVMVEFDGKPIQNLYDFTYALRAKKAGDEVKVKVTRDGKAVEVPVVLGKR